MALHPLPPCRYRGPSSLPGRIECRSQLRYVPEGTLPAHACTTCHVRDQAPSGPPLQPLPTAGQVRHLAYFVYPVGDEWRPNLASLRGRLSLFNGHRVLAIAGGAGAASRVEVLGELPDFDGQVVEVQNDARLREMAAYPRLMRELSCYRSDADVHWYGHAKGVSSAAIHPPVRLWREAMYTAQLDHWPVVRSLLRDYAAVGQFGRPDHIIPGSRCRWHFSGTFSWRRHVPLYDREWDTYDIHWCGSESHLGRLLRRSEVYSLYGDHSPAGLGLYLPEVWDGGMRQQHEAWLADRQDLRQQPMLTTVILTAARQPDLVHDAIASVLAQTTDEWHLVIVDAGELAAAGAYERYGSDGRVSVMTTGETPEQRRSTCIQGWAINEAWRRGRVRGDLVCCLSDDDVLDPGWLAAALAAARAHPDRLAWYGPAERLSIDADGRVQVLGKLDADPMADPRHGLRGRIDGMQLICRRSAWQPWPEDRRRRREADGWWMDAIAARTPVYRLDALVGRHRHTPRSTFTTDRGATGLDC